VEQGVKTKNPHCAKESGEHGRRLCKDAQCLGDADLSLRHAGPHCSTAFPIPPVPSDGLFVEAQDGLADRCRIRPTESSSTRQIGPCCLWRPLRKLRG